MVITEEEKMSSIMKNKKVMFAVIAFILIGILPLAVKGLDFGMDFKGGTIIQVNLDMSGNETIDPQTVITVLQNRINSYGLKDVSIKPWGNPVSYIVIEIAETDPKAINELQSLLGQQGKFETLYQGKAILKGEDIVSVIVNPQQGYGVRNDAQGYRWSVPFLITSEASNTFADELLGTCSTPTAETCPELLYMFIDRPENAVILMPNEIYTNEKNIPDDLYSSSNLIPVDDLVSNSGSIELIITDEITDSVIPQITGKQVIVPKGYYPIETLELYSESVLEKEKTGDYWIVSALNLENIVHITPGIAAGTPVTRPSITGSEPTQEEAAKELNRIVILLKSGKLPVSVSVGSVSTISPSLGDEFLNYSIIAGIIAMFVVAACLFIRYQRIKITIPILTTLVFEITMVLGVS